MYLMYIHLIGQKCFCPPEIFGQINKVKPKQLHLHLKSYKGVPQHDGLRLYPLNLPG